MNGCGEEERKEFWHQGIFGTAFCKSACVDVNEVVKPIMNDDIPFSVIWSKFDGIPPIRVETSVREPGDFGPQVKPTVQEPEESQNQEKGRWQHKFNHSEDKCWEIEFVLELLNGRFTHEYIEHET